MNTSPPTISGVAEEGFTLTEVSGIWTNATGSFSYRWRRCDSSGANCTNISGATNRTYTLTAADVGHTIVVKEVASDDSGDQTPALSPPTAVVAIPSATTLVSSPSSAVTNQQLTLIATVTSRDSSAGPSGSLTFKNGGAPINGCANQPVAPTGQSVTVACLASFAASSLQLTAVFTATPGASVAGSTSSTNAVAVGRDTTSTSIDVTSTVAVGTGTTYTATVTPPPGRPGPIQPTGTVDFFDGVQPISSCQARTLRNGGVTCTVDYGSTGPHSITARYGGDANFSGSFSAPKALEVVPVPTRTLGWITSTMQWSFSYTRAYSTVLALVVNGASGATVLVTCQGRGCPFAKHTALVARSTRCGPQGRRTCPTGGTLDLTPILRKRRLFGNTKITVAIKRDGWIGKYYLFSIRAHRAPHIQISCLAPGRVQPGGSCSG